MLTFLGYLCFAMAIAAIGCCFVFIVTLAMVRWGIMGAGVAIVLIILCSVALIRDYNDMVAPLTARRAAIMGGR